MSENMSVLLLGLLSESRQINGNGELVIITDRKNGNVILRIIWQRPSLRMQKVITYSSLYGEVTENPVNKFVLEANQDFDNYLQKR